LGKAVFVWPFFFSLSVISLFSAPFRCGGGREPFSLFLSTHVEARRDSSFPLFDQAVRQDEALGGFFSFLPF